MHSHSGRFFSLDVLRGVAALTVVFWHWQHFLPAGAEAVSLRARQPLYGVFYVFYEMGWLAVDLFFSLSGFVFYWLYSAVIRENRVSARSFFLLRFSRLYPLHLVTLLAVAAGQIAFHHLTQNYFAYPRIDGYHFLLNLLFVSSWGMERGWSFNAPVWSVSVEIFLYITFFILCRILRVRFAVLLTLSAIGFVAVRDFYPPIGRGIGSFYLGGCVYLAYEWIVSRSWERSVTKRLLFVVGALWLTVFLAVGAGLGSLPLPSSSGDVGYWLAVIILFPLTILALALAETCRGSLGRRISFIGDLSYSSYLIHFPLQLAVMGVATVFSVDRSVFYSPYALAGFFGALIAMSLASHRYLEMPGQRYLRARWLISGVRSSSGRPVN
jgi:peptidoglycan/LPS O-acetylase OafA/YrhL